MTKKTAAAGASYRVLRGFHTAAGKRYEIGEVLPVEVLEPHWIGACDPGSCTREVHGWMLSGDPVLALVKTEGEGAAEAVPGAGPAEV